MSGRRSPFEAAYNQRRARALRLTEPMRRALATLAFDSGKGTPALERFLHGGDPHWVNTGVGMHCAGKTLEALERAGLVEGVAHGVYVMRYTLTKAGKAYASRGREGGAR